MQPSNNQFLCSLLARARALNNVPLTPDAKKAVEGIVNQIALLCFEEIEIQKSAAERNYNTLRDNLLAKQEALRVKLSDEEEKYNQQVKKNNSLVIHNQDLGEKIKTLEVNNAILAQEKGALANRINELGPKLKDQEDAINKLQEAINKQKAEAQEKALQDIFQEQAKKQARVSKICDDLFADEKYWGEQASKEQKSTYSLIPVSMLDSFAIQRYKKLEKYYYEVRLTFLHFYNNLHMEIDQALSEAHKEKKYLKPGFFD